MFPALLRNTMGRLDLRWIEPARVRLRRDEPSHKRILEERPIPAQLRWNFLCQVLPSAVVKVVDDAAGAVRPAANREVSRRVSNMGKLAWKTTPCQENSAFNGCRPHRRTKARL